MVRGLTYSRACRILVPWLGIEPMSLALQGRVIITGPAGKSPGTRGFNDINHFFQSLPDFLLSSIFRMCFLQGMGAGVGSLLLDNGGIKTLTAVRTKDDMPRTRK